ncbi:MAG: hypothetical protein ACQEXJ_10645 [Myxococcota bacterium]
MSKQSDRFELSDDDLAKIGEWLTSAEGRAAFKTAIDGAEREIEEFDRKRQLDTRALEEPFTL